MANVTTERRTEINTKLIYKEYSCGNCHNKNTYLRDSSAPAVHIILPCGSIFMSITRDCPCPGNSAVIVMSGYDHTIIEFVGPPCDVMISPGSLCGEKTRPVI